LGRLSTITSDNNIIRISNKSKVPISKNICKNSRNINQDVSINNFFLFKKNPFTKSINPR
jgi:hypothetical protein